MGALKRSGDDKRGPCGHPLKTCLSRFVAVNQLRTRPGSPHLHVRTNDGIYSIDKSNKSTFVPKPFLLCRQIYLSRVCTRSLTIFTWYSMICFNCRYHFLDARDKIWVSLRTQTFLQDFINLIYFICQGFFKLRFSL